MNQIKLNFCGNTLRKMLFIICLIFSCSLILHAQGDITVTGVVTDETGDPMPGVNVAIKGTTIGVVSGGDGKFTIKVPNVQSVLVISFIGYTTQEITVGDQRIIDVKLQPGVELEEVVVTALGVKREAKRLGYAVSTIKAVELTKVGTPNFVTALYGKAAGVRIQSTQGGSAAAVSINVRGLSSINGNNQPLVVVNGVPIRNGNTGSGNDFAEFGAGGRIRSNGVVDINPDDIESLTILKGAAATALYGSEAANGVVMITSKRAQGKGVTVDINATLCANFVAYVPPIQTEYGPGSPSTSWNDYQKATGGFYQRFYNGQEYKSLQFESNHSWGPKFDGSPVLYWDGTVRPYQAISKNPWKELFKNGFSQVYNIGINHGGENASTRFAYTYTDESPNALTGSYNKHNFNLVGNIKVTQNIQLDYTATYVLQNLHNRVQGSLNLYGGVANMFQSFLDIPLLKKMYQTSLGYRNVNPSEATLTPDESYAFNADGLTTGVRNLLWDIYHHNSDETDNRVLASVAPSWKIIDGLTLRGRLSTDLTAERQEDKNDTERPIALYEPTTGSYTATSRRYSIYYGDIMLMYDKNITENIGLTLNAGWQGRVENQYNTSSWTNGGLTVENMFTLNASRLTTQTNVRTQDFLKTAWLGSVGVSYKDYLFLEVTGRQEKSSTLKQGSNSYFYPAVNASFIYSDALRTVMPVWFDYGKVRASYGVVGNAPAPYWANVSYDVGSSNGFTWNYVPSSLGNDAIRPETTHEWEIGLENKFFKNRLGLEVSYYERRISDMILQTPLPNSAGASNMLLNVGEMTNKGLEISLYGTPVQTKDFSWEIRTNLSFNRNEVTKLAEGVDYVESMNAGGGGWTLRSDLGRPMGDIYVYSPNVNDKGERIVDPVEGMYQINNTERTRYANAMPKVIGGLGTSLAYKNFFVDMMTDFRIGGYLVNELFQYATCRGVTNESLYGRDAEHGGLAYTRDGIQYNNGILLPGVNELKDADGNVTGYKTNDVIAPSDKYYWYTYNWGVDPIGMTYENSVMKNTYWKFRELAFGYRLPESFTSKFHCRNLTVSVFGRNLFYIYKSVKDYDVESSVGTGWTNQCVINGSASPTRTFGFSLRASF